MKKFKSFENFGRTSNASGGQRIPKNRSSFLLKRPSGVKQEKGLNETFHAAPQTPSIPAHELVKYKAWDGLVQRINEFPNDVQTPFVICDMGKMSERILLHEVCRNKPPLPVVQAIIKACPLTLRLRDSVYQFLPLHFACRFGASEEVIKALICSYPESIHTEDKYGNKPLTIVASSSNPNKVAVVNILQTFEKIMTNIPNASMIGR